MPSGLNQPDTLSDQPLWGGMPLTEVEQQQVLKKVKAIGARALRPLNFELDSHDWPEASRLNWEKLRKGQAVAVITGQQPCLHGGPALMLHKLIHTLSIVKWLEGEGVSAVPVFWNASEDHDLQEMLQVGQLNGGGDIETYRKEVAGEPVSAEVLNAIDIGGAGFDVSPLVREAFTQGSPRFAGQFTQALLHLFDQAGLVVVEPKDLASGVMDFWEKVEGQQGELIAAYGECEDKILAAGRSLQAPRRHPLPVFALDEMNGSRQAYQNISGGESFSLSLLQAKGYRPSPGALLRPLMAQWALPIAVTVLGPAEARYHEQLLKGFGVLGLETPLIWPRLGGTWVPAEVEAQLKKMGLKASEVMEQGRLEVPLDVGRDSAIRALSAHLRALRQENLGRSNGHQILDRLERDLFSALGRFERGLLREALCEKGMRPREGDRLLRFLLPRGVFQERHLGWASILKDRQHLEMIQKTFEDPFDNSHRIYP